jgi:streptogramin lyase
MSTRIETRRPNICRLFLLLFLLQWSALPGAAQVKTLLHAANGLRNPYGVCLGPDQALYICDIDNHVIHRLANSTSNGTAEKFIGTGTGGYSGDGGPPKLAQLNEPYEVRFDRDGNVYWVEMRNHLVRRLSVRDQVVTTIAGTGTAGFSGDNGPAKQAQLNQPHSIQLDAAGNLYICDIGNHRIREVEAASGTIRTFAGNGERLKTPDGSRFADTPLHGPRAIDFDPDGNIWLALREGNAIYKLDPHAGTIHHVAGTGAKGFKNGPAKEATLSGPKGLSVGPDGHIYFADTESHTIRRVNRKSDTVEVIVGTGERGNGPDGNPLQCKLARPHGIFVSPDRTLYIGDSENNRLRALKLLPN